MATATEAMVRVRVNDSTENAEAPRTSRSKNITTSISHNIAIDNPSDTCMPTTVTSTFRWFGSKGCEGVVMEIRFVRIARFALRVWVIRVIRLPSREVCTHEPTCHDGPHNHNSNNSSSLSLWIFFYQHPRYMTTAPSPSYAARTENGVTWDRYTLKQITRIVTTTLISSIRNRVAIPCRLKKK